MMFRCISYAVFCWLSVLFIPTVSAVESEYTGWTTYVSPLLGVSFDIAAERKVVKCHARGSSSCIMIVDQQQQHTPASPTTLHIVSGSLIESVAKEQDFYLQEGKWYSSYGEGLFAEMEEITFNGWQGMRGVVNCVASGERQSLHSSIGDCFKVVLSDGRRSIVVRNLHIRESDIMHSLETVKFISVGF